MVNASPGKFLVYVGTYTMRGSKGIYLCRFDAASGKLGNAELAAELPNPTFLALHPPFGLAQGGPEKKSNGPSGGFLYSVSEVRDSGGRRGGSVSAFARDPRTGELTFLNRQSSEGAGPCHLSVDPAGRCVLVANYASGSVALLPIQRDGLLGEASDTVQHHGSGVNPERQEGPHAHSITPSPDGRFALAADLGLDRIMVYKLEGGRLTPNDPPFASTSPGAGPRHLAFHPARPIVYLINEMGNTITVFAWDASRGALSEIQTVPTLPAGFAGENTTADVHVAPSGRFVYGSNRGHDSIATFCVDESSGRLTASGHQSSLGKCPRNFAIDPAGNWLLAANQDSDSLVVFRADSATGRLTPAGQPVTLSMPVCVKMVPCSDGCAL